VYHLFVLLPLRKFIVQRYAFFAGLPFAARGAILVLAIGMVFLFSEPS
jgi:hypothetical protein